MKILLLIGLPGSGKSTLGRSLASKSCIFIDDISQETKNAKDFLSCVKEKLHPSITQLVIADVQFCKSQVLLDAKNILEKIFPTADIEYIFFKNEPDQCARNVEKRMSKGDKREVRGAIKLLSQDYAPPDFALSTKYD